MAVNHRNAAQEDSFLGLEAVKVDFTAGVYAGSAVKCF